MEETESKSSQSGDIYVPWSQHLSGQITQWYRLHFRRSYLQRYTLGDKLQQHGEAPFSQQQIASCVLENFCENVCRCNWILLPQQVAQFQSDLIFCNLLQQQNSVAETKIFPKILQYTQSNLS